jgi:RNA polymerase-binding transcription factor DksA
VDPAVARKRLEEMLADVDRSVATLQAENAIPATNGGQDIDTSDPGAALTDADRESAVIEALGAQAKQIRAALERIDGGTFGKCVVCGQELPEERLDARPEAARCVADQARAESGR